MKYEELRSYFSQFHCGLITKQELIAAITMWQRGEYFPKPMYDGVEEWLLVDATLRIARCIR